MCSVDRAHRRSGDGWAWSDGIELATDSCSKFHETEHVAGSLVTCTTVFLCITVFLILHYCSHYIVLFSSVFCKCLCKHCHRA
jgi:hypothetical protein